MNDLEPGPAMSREALGEFEHQVLLVVLRLGGRSYSAPIVMELESKTGRSVSLAAVFVALRRLEQRGYVRSTKRAAKAGEGGSGRRTCELTALGRSKLGESRRTFEKLWRGTDLLGDRT